MRILSWNINGIRTLPKYHPWNTFDSCEGILDELKADIICFQEVKSSRASLPRDVAIPGRYHSFFSFPVSKGGYSGVAVYTNSRTAAPLKAEEGLSGRLQPQPPLSAEERVSPSYPYPHDITAYPDEQGEVPATFEALDAEGRGLVVDFGLFVLINVYCPNETSDARLSFKMNYHLMLQERVRKLIEEEHREVIVLGDINVCATPLDHAEGHFASSQDTFYEHPARAWFHKWRSPNGPMIDVIRTFWPERKGLYTCWNTKLQARETNYGGRIDYILVTKGLLPWISHGDIQPSLKGSDHCPIYIDLRDEITLGSGETIKLRDAMQQTDTAREPPRIAAKFWDEFSGKQTVLSAFFGKRAVSRDASNDGQPTPSLPSTSQQSNMPDASSTVTDVQLSTTQPASQPVIKHPPSPEVPKKLKPSQPSKPAPSPATNKRKPPEPTASSSKKRKQVKGQASLASFFSKPAAASGSKSREVIEIDDETPAASTSALAPDTPPLSQAEQDQLDADYRLACELAQEDAEPSPTPSSFQNPTQKKAVWSELFAPIQPPHCTVHGEPTKMYTVNKPGPNKGKTFFICSRPVGPGYDKGKSERLREEVDHRYRCNYFKWTSDVKKASLRERERTRTLSQGP
ncbi:DNA-(apurinic or apyrimidinic site) lyase 2 [Trametes pubescens]|uniref:DNA-(apurinic or apyrimidinic site) endonuclease n=1 Tax=Trametes pubescens TaxID=154538 RepID=A0A1M2VXU5_TRAPU|nr:DNA-(apurinic or apyrimidinic site) lyase 2 [Trametes pubescens]